MAEPDEEIGKLEAAQILNVSPSRIIKLAWQDNGGPAPVKRLRGRKSQVGGPSAPWLFKRSEVERLAALHRPAGHPRKEEVTQP